MKTLQIQVPDMQSAHCQARVTSAVKSLNSVTILGMGPGWVKVSLEDHQDTTPITQAIEDAGYPIAGLLQSSTPLALRFKTNINCSGCVAKASPALDALTDSAGWHVDIENKDKILTVHSKGISEQRIMEAVQQSGFKIEPIK